MAPITLLGHRKHQNRAEKGCVNCFIKYYISVSLSVSIFSSVHLFQSLYFHVSTLYIFTSLYFMFSDFNFILPVFTLLQFQSLSLSLCFSLYIFHSSSNHISFLYVCMFHSITPSSSLIIFHFLLSISFIFHDLPIANIKLLKIKVSKRPKKAKIKAKQVR